MREERKTKWRVKEGKSTLEEEVTVEEKRERKKVSVHRQ